MPKDYLVKDGFIPFSEDITWTLWRRKNYFSGEKKLIFQFTKRKFTSKEEKEIIWTAYKLGLKFRSEFQNKTARLILPGELQKNNIYIEYY